MLRSVRRVAALAAWGEVQKRSITEARKRTVSSSSRPIERPKSASFAAANNSALARSRLLGCAEATTRREKAATSGAQRLGDQAPIAAAVADLTR